jgi:hypothetical protein
MACTSPEHVVPATVELMIARQTGLGIARSRDRQRRGGVGLLGELVERDLDPESSLLIATRIFSVECVGSDGGSVTAGCWKQSAVPQGDLAFAMPALIAALHAPDTSSARPGVEQTEKAA